MIYRNELQKSLERNSLAGAKLTVSPRGGVPGHQYMMIDITGLSMDLMRLTDKLCDYVVGRNIIAAVGGRQSPDEIRKASIENTLRNSQQKRKKEAIHGK